MQYRELLDQLRSHVSHLFRTHQDSRFIYHNLEHTQQVVENATMISNHYRLADRQFFIVMAACWFHDIGYFYDCSQHEAKGTMLAQDFLRENGAEQVLIDEVSGCIRATMMPQKPDGLLQEIVCDADLFHLGSNSFKERNRLMRKEAEAFCNQKIDKAKWRDKTIELFKAHHFHTAYCREMLDQKKAQNLAELEAKALEVPHKTSKDTADIQDSGERASNQISTKEGKKNKNDRPDRGIETMFRITSANHQRLSDMADNKAHIMISTNSIILSVILSLLLRKLEDNPHLIIPTLLLLIICVVTMVFSILATRPSIPTGIFSAEDIRAKRVNLLFFGNFYRMTLPDYEDGMLKMMGDREFLYGSLIRDVYAQGVVLGRKYRLLRVAYNVFMFGIVAAVLAFIIAAALVAL